MADNIPGNENENDAYQHLWTIDWVKESISTFKNPYYTDKLFYPLGVSLALHNLTLFNSVISIPIQIIFNLIIAQNLLLILSFIITAYGMYALTFYLTKNKTASFIAGFIFSFSPYHFAHFFVNHLEEVSMGWIPLFILYLIKTIKERDIKNPILASVFLIITALSHWYYLFYIVLFSLILLLYYLITEKKIFNKYSIWGIALLFIVAALILTPFILPMIKEITNNNNNNIVEESNQLIRYSSHISDYFKPNSFTNPPPLKPQIRKEYGEFNSFLGYVNIFLVIFFLLVNKSKKRFFWVLSALFFFLLSLGPYLNLFGKTFKNIPLPYTLFYKIFPFFSLMGVPSRFNVMVILSIAVIVGFSITELNKKIRNKKIVFIILAIIFIEFLPLNFPTTKIHTPTIYQYLAEDKEDYAILELPFEGENDGIYMYYQTIHKKKLLEGYLGRTPSNAYNFIKNNKLISTLNNLCSNKNQLITITTYPHTEIEDGFNSLKNNNIKYILIHEKCKDKNKINTFLKNLTNTIYKCEDILVFDLFNEKRLENKCIN